jgi:Fe-S cluster assembly protein SufD
MSSITQYIDLYNEHAATVNANSAPAINALRTVALAALAGATLPTTRSEGYEKTSIEDMLAPDLGVNITRVHIPVNVAATFKCEVPRLSTVMGFVLNDSFYPAEGNATRLPEGVIFGSLAKVAAEHPELVARYYGKIAPMENVGVALNSLLVQDGVVVYVPRGVKMEKPIQLVNIFSSTVATAAFRRILVVVEEDASAQILVCDHTQDAEHAYLSQQIVELAVAKNASLELYDMEESSALTSRWCMTYATQQEGSHLLINGTTLSNGSTRNDYVIDILGEHCDTFLGGMAIGSAKQHIDNDSTVNHRAPRCSSRQMFKYILDDEASGAFEGGITVHPGAILTEAYQSNRNLLASTGARMHTKPQLLIYCDDVKCSHGATTGQLDQEALFYMRQRGISEKTARTMLMQAFMADVIDTVGLDGLRDRLRHLVEMRLHGRTSFCADCQMQ